MNYIIHFKQVNSKIYLKNGLKIVVLIIVAKSWQISL